MANAEITKVVIEAQLNDLAELCGTRRFAKVEQNFLEVYSIYLFNKRNALALSQRQAKFIDKLWEQYYA